jgi:hypothetical protein
MQCQKRDWANADGLVVHTVEARRMPRSQQAAGTGERLWAQCNHAVTTGPEGFMQIRHGVMHVAALAGSRLRRA